MSRGTVTWFNDDQGYGFIRPSDGSPDVFVHFSEIQSEFYPTLAEADDVTYETERGLQGPRAINVRPAGEPSRPHLRQVRPAPEAGVRSFAGASVRQLEWEINEWAIDEGVEILSVSLVQRPNDTVAGLVAFRRIAI
jgi:cold shock protein